MASRACLFLVLCLAVNAYAQCTKTSGICDLAITNKKIADNAVKAINLASKAVETSKIAPGAVVTGKIKDSAVTLAKLAQEVTDAIADASVIADGSITASKLDTVIVSLPAPAKGKDTGAATCEDSVLLNCGCNCGADGTSTLILGQLDGKPSCACTKCVGDAQAIATVDLLCLVA